MANYMGSTFENTPIQSSVNLPLIQQVLSVKQGQYDANRAKIDQTLSAFGNIDLIRDVDKDYLSAKMNDVYNTIESSGNRDFSQSYIADDIVGKVRNAAKDPFIMDAMANTAKFRTFQKDVEEVKKKDITKFNNANYNDALELGGFGEWSKGDTNSLGTLQYNEYTDAKGNARKLAEDYVKNFQMKEHLLGKEAGQYFDQYTYGYDVDEAAVKRYVDANLDEKSRVQLQIDARQSVGKLPEADFYSYIRTAKEADNRNANLQISTLEAAVKSETSKDAKDFINNRIKELKAGVSENNAKIASGRFDKNEMYSVYNDKVSSGIAAGFDLKGTTKVDTDDSKFQVAKWEFDKEAKKEDLRLKGIGLELQAAQLKTAQDTLTTLQGGTPIDVPYPNKPEVAETNVVKSDLSHSDQALDTYLKQTNPDGYKDKKPNDQWAYKTSLQYTNPLVKTDSTLNGLLINFKNSHKAFIDTFSPQIDSAAKLYDNVYNDMIGGKDLSTNNFAKTAPMTAAMLKSKKPFDSLTPAEQSGVRMELITNSLRYGELDPNARDIAEKALNRERVKLNANTSDNAQAVKNHIKSSVIDTEDSGFLGALRSVGRGVLGVGKLASSSAFGALGDMYDRAAYGSDYADKQLKQRYGRENTIMNQINKASDSLYGAASNIFSPYQDRDISEIEAQDLRANSTIKEGSVIKYLNDNLNSYHDLANETAKTFKPTQISNKGYAYSEKVKAQQPIAIALQQTALAQKDVPVGFHEADNFSVQREGANFRISATSKKGNPVSVVVTSIPPAVTKVLDFQNPNWNTSAMNKNVAVQTDTIKPVGTIVDRKQGIDNILQSAQGILSQESISRLIHQPSESFMATPDEIADSYRKRYGKNHEDIINKVTQMQIAFTPYTDQGQFWTKAVYTDPETNRPKETYFNQTPLGDQYDPSALYLHHLDMARMLKDKIVEEIINPPKH